MEEHTYKFDPDVVTVGLFGTCDTSTWREPFIARYRKLGIRFFNPQVPSGQWQDWMKENERVHLYNDHVILFPVLAESYGVGSLGETGFSVLQAVSNLHRDVVVLIEQSITPELVEKNPEMAKASIRGRRLVAEHLKGISRKQITNEDMPHLYVVEKMDDLLDLSLTLYHSQVAIHEARRLMRHASELRIPYEAHVIAK